MTNFLSEEMNKTRTENGAATYVSTGSNCLDLFATVGAMRRAQEEEIIARFTRAYIEDPDTAMKLLFFARDVRGGLGERRTFRVIFRRLAKNYPDSVKKNLDLVAEYGRFDDLLVLFDTPCEREMLECLHKQYVKDLSILKNRESSEKNRCECHEQKTGSVAASERENISLLGKWLPSVNASGKETVRKAKRVARAFGISEAKYRRDLSALRKEIRILENFLRRKDYSFDYEKQPSRAMFKYHQAFLRNDRERYQEFLSRVSKGEAKLHADQVAPYELVEPYLQCSWSSGRYSFVRDMTPEEAEVLNATWASLPDFGNGENALAVIDTSGSMYSYHNPMPAAVALSLGLYFAEHNKGFFANQFIEFSEDPVLIELKGKTFTDKLRYAASLAKVANTDLQRVFDTILRAAVKAKVKKEEMPSKIIIISDMEFDQCVYGADVTNFEYAKARFEAYGYRLPEIVFWNVASRNRQQPVRQNEQGVALVSGATPRLFEMIAGGVLSPYRFMMEILNSERYAKVAA